jgi:hypothetical protein
MEGIMPTLRDMIASDFGVEEVKTASADASSEIDALAARYGFDFAKTASEDKKEEEKEEKEEEKEDKVASAFGLDSYFSECFPEDGALNKTAEELEKVAYQENLGARAYDHFSARWDNRVEKLAAECYKLANSEANVHEDPTIPQAFPTNRPSNASSKIDTKPEVTDEIHSKDDARTVGHLQQKSASLHDLAMRKALILSQLEG